VRGSGADTPSAVALLDQAVDLVTGSPGAVAVLWLTALPARFLLVGYLQAFGNTDTPAEAALLVLAYAMLALWLPSLYGRQVFVRACRRGMEGEVPEGGWGLRVPLRELAGAVVAALLVEVVFWALAFTFVVPLAMVVAAALAAAAAPVGGPSPAAAVRSMLDGTGRVLTLAFLFLLCALAALLAGLNLHVLFVLSTWLARSVAPLDTPAWARLLSYANPLYRQLLVVGATLLVEPFWLAAVAVHVERVRSQSSGEDLRHTFEELRRQDAEVA